MGGEMHTEILSEIPKRTNHLAHLHTDGKIILKYMLEEFGVNICTRFS
jgi:hypothetical protein